MTVSSAAIATLTVSESTLQGDLVLSLLSNVASTKQLKVNVKKGKKPVPTELAVLNSTVPLKERAAILRSMCGLAFCNALDKSGPLYWLGGHSSPCYGSKEDALAMASIASWMSISASLTGDQSTEPTFLEPLDKHLESRAFLAPSSSCTVADLDLAAKLFAKAESCAAYPNVKRWLLQCHADCTRLAEGTAVVVPPIALATPAQAMPVFFYQMEENAMPKKKQLTPPKPAAAAAAQGSDKKKDNQKKDNKQEKKKNEKAPAQKQQQQAPADFAISALDIRVGKITKVWPHAEAEKLFCEEIDLGEGSPRSIASGLRPFYKQEDMEGKMVLVLANLKKRNLVGFPSHGMVLCSSNADHTKVEIVSPPEGTQIGERVMFDGHSGDPEPENKIAKKKVFEKLAPDLKTTSDGVVVWKGATAKTSAGIVKGMPDGQVA